MIEFVRMSDGEISISPLNSVAEAKLAIKQLKLKKKEFDLQKREVNQAQKQIRAKYTDSIRKQGSRSGGRDTLGKLMRTLEKQRSDAMRRELAEALEPLEQKKYEIESVLNKIESSIIQVESYIIQNS